MMARAKRIYILMIKINEGFNYFSSRCFLKEIENMFSVFLSSYRNTRGLGELEKAVETLAYRRVFPKHFSFAQLLPLVYGTWGSQRNVKKLNLSGSIVIATSTNPERVFWSFTSIQTFKALLYRPLELSRSALVELS